MVMIQCDSQARSRCSYSVIGWEFALVYRQSEPLSIGVGVIELLIREHEF